MRRKDIDIHYGAKRRRAHDRGHVVLNRNPFKSFYDAAGYSGAYLAILICCFTYREIWLLALAICLDFVFRIAAHFWLWLLVRRIRRDKELIWPHHTMQNINED